MSLRQPMFDRLLDQLPIPASELGPRVQRAGAYGLFAALMVIYFWFGGMKFTSYEANGLVGLVKPSPLIGWMYHFMSVQGFSYFLGVLELTIGGLIGARYFSPKFSLIGGVLSCGLFVTTFSMLFSTPGAFEPSLGFPAISVLPGQFLLKDAGLFAASLFVIGESLTAISVAKPVTKANAPAE